jgi:hypothetical protein
MRHITWAMTWILVGLAATLATANVLTHYAALHRAPLAGGYSAAIAFSTNIFLSKSSATLPSLASCSTTSILA